MTPEQQAKAQTMLNVLLNALRYHFQDKTVYVDGYDVADTESYQTSSLDEVNNFYRQLSVKRSVDKLTVNGLNVGAKQNLLARDINFDANLALIADDKPSLMTSSSFVVIHQLEGMLDFNTEGVVDHATFDWTQYWADPATAKVNAAKYKISN